MSDEMVPTNTKCPTCGYVTADPFNCVMCADGFARFIATSPENFDPRERAMASAYLSLRATPPTPDPRERGEDADMDGLCHYCFGPIMPTATHHPHLRYCVMELAARIGRPALRAPAPSEAVRKFSAAHTRAMSELEFTHGVGVRGDAPSEAVAWLIEKPQPGGVYWWHGKRHALAAINEDYNPDHFPSAIAYEFGPVAAEAVRFNSREDADVVIRRFPPQWRSVLIASEHMWVSAHPAPARGVTEDMVMIPRSLAHKADGLLSLVGHRHKVRGVGADAAEFIEASLEFRAALTPDAEGGA